MKRSPLKPGKPLQRKTPLKARAGLKSKRAKPRRNESRIDHGRIGGPRNPDPSAEQREYWAWLRDERGCVISGAKGGQNIDPQMRCTIHHITSDGYKRLSRNHWYVIPLRADLHQIIWGPKFSIEAMGHENFCIHHEIDVLAAGHRLLDWWIDSTGRGGRADLTAVLRNFPF